MFHHVGQADPPLAIEELVSALCAALWVSCPVIVVRFPLHDAFTDRSPFFGIPFASIRGGLPALSITGIYGGV